MRLVLALIITLSAAGCGGYQCTGPACPTDAAIDAGARDAGVLRECSTSCPGCCDGQTGRCAGGSDWPFSDSTCRPTNTDGVAVVYCVACGTGQLCVPHLGAARCETRTSRCVTACTGCCNEATGQCARGTTEALCGAGGTACRDCGAGMTCRLNSCVTYP